MGQCQRQEETVVLMELQMCRQAKGRVQDRRLKIENGVVDGYKKIENGVVSGYQKIENKFVDQFLTKEGESVEDAKKRLANELNKQN